MSWLSGEPAKTGTDRKCSVGTCANNATHETYLFWTELKFGDTIEYCPNIEFPLCKEHLKKMGIPKDTST